jgi:hypothetical protein
MAALVRREGPMNGSDSTREQVERDPRNDQRSRTHADEIVVDRQPIVADRPASDTWPAAPMERRRTERRRIERMSTDI